jgi:hypothetical protein
MLTFQHWPPIRTSITASGQTEPNRAGLFVESLSNLTKTPVSFTVFLIQFDVKEIFFQ